MKAKWAWLLLGSLLLPACVAPEGAKTASAEASRALSELAAAERDFEREYLALIDTALDQIEDTLVTRAVDAKLRALAQGAGGNLIAISEQVPEERRRARALLRDLRRFRLKPDETGESALARYRRQAAERLARLRSGPDADVLAGVPVGDPGLLDGAEDDVLALFELRRMRARFAGNIRGLRDVVTVLGEAHSVIDDWVQTDVTVSGESVGALLEKHARTLGLE